jgi:hypothetical protein
MPLQWEIEEVRYEHSNIAKQTNKQKKNKQKNPQKTNKHTNKQKNPDC